MALVGVSCGTARPSPLPAPLPTFAGGAPNTQPGAQPGLNGVSVAQPVGSTGTVIAGATSTTPSFAKVVTVVNARTGPITAQFSYAGLIQVKDSVNLAPRTLGRIDKYLVDVGTPVKAGQVLVQLDHADLDSAVSQAKANLLLSQAKLDGMLAQGRPEAVAAAQANVQSAQAKLHQLAAGSTNAALKNAIGSVANAQSAYDAATASYNHLTSPTPDEIKSLKAQVDNAKAAMDAAQHNYDLVAWATDISGRPESVALAQATNNYQVALSAYNLRIHPRPSDVTAAQQAVDSAKAQLTSAQAQLNLLQSGANADDLKVAEAAYQQAKDNLALTQTPNSPTDIEQARAQVALDQARLESAQLQAAEAQIVAPFDGIVAARLLADGAVTSPTAPALTLVSKQVDILVQVEENNLPLFQVGQAVDVTVPAYNGRLFNGKITEIAPVGNTTTHMFTLHVTPDDPQGQLHGGMFANVRIHTTQQPNAVLVPVQAIITRNNKSYVFVVVNGKAVAHEVDSYQSDGNYAAIPSGVNPNDPVVISGLMDLNNGDPVRASAQPATPATGQ